MFSSGAPEPLGDVAAGTVARRCVTALSQGRIRATVLMSNDTTTVYVNVLVPEQGVPAEQVVSYAPDAARRVAERCVRLT
jgi:hypothetical protein